MRAERLVAPATGLAPVVRQWQLGKGNVLATLDMRALTAQLLRAPAPISRSSEPSHTPLPPPTGAPVTPAAVEAMARARPMAAVPASAHLAGAASAATGKAAPWHSLPLQQRALCSVLATRLAAPGMVLAHLTEPAIVIWVGEGLCALTTQPRARPDKSSGPLPKATLMAAHQSAVVVTACAPQAVAALVIVLSGGEGRAVKCAAALPTPFLLRRFRVGSTPRHAPRHAAVAAERASPRKAVCAGASWATAAADASP